MLKFKIETEGPLKGVVFRGSTHRQALATLIRMAYAIDVRRLYALRSPSNGERRIRGCLSVNTAPGYVCYYADGRGRVVYCHQNQKMAIRDFDGGVQ